jgi:hypothetical protein
LPGQILHSKAAKGLQNRLSNFGKATISAFYAFKLVRAHCAARDKAPRENISRSTAVANNPKTFEEKVVEWRTEVVEVKSRQEDNAMEDRKEEAPNNVGRSSADSDG